MDKFKDVRNIHNFVKAQMVAAAKLDLIWLRIYHPKMDLDEVVEGVLLRSLKKKIKFYRHIAVVSHVAEKMIDKLLEIDSSFFKEYRYDDSTQQMLVAKENIDRLI
jgi:hypothetical protein